MCTELTPGQDMEVLKSSKGHSAGIPPNAFHMFQWSLRYEPMVIASAWSARTYSRSMQPWKRLGVVQGSLTHSILFLEQSLTTLRSGLGRLTMPQIAPTMQIPGPPQHFPQNWLALRIAAFNERNLGQRPASIHQTFTVHHNVCCLIQST